MYRIKKKKEVIKHIKMYRKKEFVVIKVKSFKKKQRNSI